MQNIRSICRFCSTPLNYTLIDIGMSPLANSYIKEEQLNNMEPFYPLHVLVCEKCYLVQLPVFESPKNIFEDYAYFSSFSDSWLKHAKMYTDLMIDRFHLGPHSQVIEIASNDGYLLQYFKAKDIPVLGIEPAKNVAKVAQDAGISTLTKFFGVQTASELTNKGISADLLIGNNVLAHVPDINDFIKGMKIALKPQGIITMEFPHLMRLIEENQFDTIYHEHFSYFSFLSVEKIFSSHGLTIFDVDELPTHGGSLRIYARHAEDSSQRVSRNVIRLRNLEESQGYARMEFYGDFTEKVKQTKRKILKFLIDAKHGRQDQ